MIYTAYGERYFNQPTAIDLFCGCGGFSLGIIQAGFNLLAGIDNEPAALATYYYNLCGPDTKVLGDLKIIGKMHKCHISGNKTRKAGQQLTIEEKCRFNPYASWFKDTPPVSLLVCDDIRHWTGGQILRELGLQVGEVDLVVGGPPCQGVSQINNKRSIDDPRNLCLWEFARLVGEIEPRVFMMENVPGLVKIGKGVLHRELLQRLSSIGMGYHIKWDILNAADYGVPQNRRRVLYLGQRIYQFGDPSLCELIQGEFFQQRVLAMEP